MTLTEISSFPITAAELVKYYIIYFKKTFDYNGDLHSPTMNKSVTLDCHFIVLFLHFNKIQGQYKHNFYCISDFSQLYILTPHWEYIN